MDDAAQPLGPSSQYLTPDYAAKAAEKRWEALSRAFEDLSRPSGDLIADLEAGKNVLFQRGLYVPFCRVASDSTAGDYDVEFIASTEGFKRDPYIVHNDGWELGPFTRNPVLLWCHDYYGLPLGHHIGAEVIRERSEESGQMEPMLRMRAVFATQDEYPFANTVRKLYLGRHLRTCSVSWEPISGKYKEILDRAGRKVGIEFFRQILTENSCVPLPSDPNALVVAVQKRIISSEDLENMTRFIPSLTFQRSIAYTVADLPEVEETEEEKMARAAAEADRVQGATPGRSAGKQGTPGQEAGERPSKKKADCDKRQISFPRSRSYTRGAMADSMQTQHDQLMGAAIVFWNDVIPALRGCVFNTQAEEDAKAAGYPNASVGSDMLNSCVGRAKALLASMTQAVDAMGNVTVSDLTRSLSEKAEEFDEILARVGKAISAKNHGTIREAMGGITASMESLHSSMVKLQNVIDKNVGDDEGQADEQGNQDETDTTDKSSNTDNVDQSGLTPEERKKAERVFRTVADGLEEITAALGLQEVEDETEDGAGEAEEESGEGDESETSEGEEEAGDDDGADLSEVLGRAAEIMELFDTSPEKGE